MKEDDRAFLNNLIGVFLQDAKRRIEGLAAASDEHDHASMVRLAHELKGSAAAIGARRLAQACEDLEQGLSEGDAQPMSLGRVKDEFASARKELERRHRPHDTLP